MKSLIYISTADSGIDYTDVLNILTISTRANHTHGISGMLVFDGIYFLQYIEGNDQSILHLYDNLKKDSRHHSLKCLSEISINERLFPQWNMGYLNNQQTTRSILLKITGDNKLNPDTLTASRAKLILIELSHLL